MINEYKLLRFKKIFSMWGREAFADAWLDRAIVKTDDLTDFEMVELSNYLIDNCDRAPSISKLISFASIIRNKKKAITQDNQGLINCPNCDGDGYRSEIRSMGGRDYSFAVTCINHGPQA